MLLWRQAKGRRWNLGGMCSTSTLCMCVSTKRLKRS